MTQTLIEQLEKLQLYWPGNRGEMYPAMTKEGSRPRYVGAADLRAIIEQHKRESGEDDAVTIDSEELAYLKDMDEHVRQITNWLRERGLYHDADYFGEGVDYPAILTMHENELLRPQPSHTKIIGELVKALEDDAYAASFQSMAGYRKWLLDLAKGVGK